MRRGYIKVWRNLEDSGIIGNAEVCQLFLYLILGASSRRRKQAAGTDIVSLEPGQLVTSRRQLALRLGSTEQKIRTALSTLEKHGIITQLPTRKHTLISLVNWSKYQHEQAEAPPRSGPPPAQARPAPNPQPAQARPAPNPQPAQARPAPNPLAARVQPAPGPPPARVQPAPGPPSARAQPGQQEEKNGRSKNIKPPMNTSLALAKSARVEQGRCQEGGEVFENGKKNPEDPFGRHIRPPVSGPVPSGAGALGPGGAGMPGDSAPGGAGVPVCSAPGDSAPVPFGAGVSMPSGTGREPGREFAELREFYDKNARPEGPGTGLAEFKQAKAARLWPGTARFCQAVADLAANDCEWLRGRRPGLRRFISERMWEMRPRADSAGRAQEAPAKTPEQREREKREQQRILNTLFASPHKKKQATTTQEGGNDR